MLSAAFVRTINRPGRYGDGRGGHGLSLLVKATAIPGRWSKTWSQRLRINGRPVMVGLGSYPVVTLAQARRRALENRQALEQGRDPRGEGVPTFEQAAERVIALHRETWKPGSRSEQQWTSSLGTYVLPKIGAKRVDQINVGDILAVLAEPWSSRPETARRIAQRISAVLTWAVGAGYRADDPTAAAVKALPRHMLGPCRQGRRGRPSALGPARGPCRGHGAMGPICQREECLTPHRIGHLETSSRTLPTARSDRIADHIRWQP